MLIARRLIYGLLGLGVIIFSLCWYVLVAAFVVSSPVVWFFVFSVPVTIVLIPVISAIEDRIKNSWIQSIFAAVVGWTTIIGTILLMFFVGKLVSG